VKPRTQRCQPSDVSSSRAACCNRSRSRARPSARSASDCQAPQRDDATESWRVRRSRKPGAETQRLPRSQSGDCASELT
jgi:hypothetical protein